MTVGAGVPERIGRYRVVRVLGQGGMGAVYEAEQDSPRRRVALKVVRGGAPSDELLRRFRFEAEVLGRLRHPGIAQVYDAGTVGTDAGELPFFAMELVEGETLDAWLLRTRPSHDERVRIVAAICDAVQHAHQQGVIHRDLKPANVLVDGEGRPKVVDFGVARATRDAQLTLMETQAGQILGTLAYMSPEQVAGDPEAIDTRSDVYALGVILYETVSGRHPYPLAGRGLTEAVRMVTEAGAPRLREALPGVDVDLEVVVAKALARERDERYASAGALGEDLRRYLRDEPISARPPTARYQLRKLAHRHRAAFVGALFTLSAIVAGLAVSLVLYLREREALERESEALRGEQQARLAEQAALASERDALAAEQQARAEVEKSHRVTTEVVDFLGGMLGTPGDDTVGDEVTLASALLRAQGWLDGAEARYSPEGRARIQAILGGSLLAVDRPEEGERNLLASVSSPASEGVPRALALLDLANARARRGACDLAVDDLDEGLALARTLRASRPDVLLRALPMAISVLRGCGRHERADALIDELLAEAALPDVAPVLSALTRSRALRMRGEIAYEQARPADARDALVASLDAWDASGAERTIEYAQTLDTLAGTLATLGDRTALELSEHALELTRRVRGNRSGDSAASLANRAVYLMMLGGDVRAAESALAESVAITRELHPDGTPELAGRLDNLAEARFAAGRPEQALEAAREALAVAERFFGEVHPEVALALMTIARLEEALGRTDDVLDLHRRALAINRATLGDDHRNTILQMGLVGRAAYVARDLDTAAACYREAYERASAPGSTAADLVGDFRTSLVRVLRKRGDDASAAEADALEARGG